VVEAEKLADPVVRQFVEAVNAGDRDAFFALLTPNASMSDDGTERELEEWVDREVFSSEGRMEVESQSDDGRSLIVNYTNSTLGSNADRLEVRGRGGQGEPLRDRPGPLSG
jgi:hypothetical protein